MVELNKQLKKRPPQGFTLIEIMVVIVIIGILAALIIPRVVDKVEQSRVVAAKADIQSISNAVGLYQLDHSLPPSTLNDLLHPASSLNSGTSETYLSKLPVDPWGHAYQYLYPGVKNPTGYDLWSWGPSGQTAAGENGQSVIGNWS